MPPERKYSSVAAKQAAYRERKRNAEPLRLIEDDSKNPPYTDIEAALDVLADVKGEIVTLLKAAEYSAGKNQSFELQHNTGLSEHCHSLRGGVFHNNVSIIVIRHLLRTNQLEKIRSDWMGAYYRFK